MIGYPKLVRDKVPYIIKKSGRCPIIHTATDEEYKEKLNQKLLEKVFEYSWSGRIEELVDVMEVVYAIAKKRGINKIDLYRLQRKKAKEKGKFLCRIILDEVK
jgi:predicted house-cleaning noncanonical NTP pyrophosphatase (MazG superfamily)